MKKSRKALVEILHHAIHSEECDANLAAARELLKISHAPEDHLLASTVLLDGGRAKLALNTLENLDLKNLDTEQRKMHALRVAEVWYVLGCSEKSIPLLESIDSYDQEERAELIWWSALCYDHLGERAKADALFREGSKLDPDRFPPPTAISADEALLLLENLITKFPAPLRKAIEEIPIGVEDLPSRESIRTSEGTLHPDTLGLYTGVCLSDRSHFSPYEFPSSVHIFRRNLERFSRDREELEEELRITLLHEIGHHLGLDEGEVDALGLH